MKKGTILITLGLLLITAAFCLVGYNLYESYKAGQASDSIMEELERAIAEANAASQDSSDETDGEGDGVLPGGISDGTTGNGSQSADGQNASDLIPGASDGNMGELFPDRDMPSYSIDSIGYVGWIFIPSLSIRLPVQDVWNYDLLTISPSRYSGSVYQDNMIIGGHSYITHFRGLRNIAPGARVTFYDVEGYSYEYEVEYVMTLNPNQGVVLSDEKHEDWDLTLFTCNTGGQTRCVVRCVRIE